MRSPVSSEGSAQRSAMLSSTFVIHDVHPFDAGTFIMGKRTVRHGLLQTSLSSPGCQQVRCPIPHRGRPRADHEKETIRAGETTSALLRSQQQRPAVHFDERPVYRLISSPLMGMERWYR